MASYPCQMLWLRWRPQRTCSCICLLSLGRYLVEVFPDQSLTVVGVAIAAHLDLRLSVGKFYVVLVRQYSSCIYYCDCCKMLACFVEAKHYEHVLRSRYSYVASASFDNLLPLTYHKQIETDAIAIDSNKEE